MTDGPDLSKSPRSKPRPAADSGVHPAELGQPAAKATEAPAAPGITLGADGLPIKAEKEETRSLSTYVSVSTRALIDQVNKERGFSIREVVELAVNNFWGKGK
ncbi:hypothetical protein ACIQTZ_22870 [Paenarthrobacter sp. NPDC090520]|uniref:hypothetical protein n=1 Tax=Paenarthrobacter sp. NPDC090520 TaxID=3364382 RepID=UPI00382CDB03